MPVNEDVLLALKLYNLAAQTLLRMVEKSGTTIEEVRASVDAEESAFFAANNARIAALSLPPENGE